MPVHLYETTGLANALSYVDTTVHLSAALDDVASCPLGSAPPFGSTRQVGAGNTDDLYTMYTLSLIHI